MQTWMYHAHLELDAGVTDLELWSSSVESPQACKDFETVLVEADRKE